MDLCSELVKQRKSSVLCVIVGEFLDRIRRATDRKFLVVSFVHGYGTVFLALIHYSRHMIGQRRCMHRPATGTKLSSVFELMLPIAVGAYDQRR